MWPRHTKRAKSLLPFLGLRNGWKASPGLSLQTSRRVDTSDNSQKPDFSGVTWTRAWETPVCTPGSFRATTPDPVPATPSSLRTSHLCFPRVRDPALRIVLALGGGGCHRLFGRTGKKQVYSGNCITFTSKLITRPWLCFPKILARLVSGQADEANFTSDAPMTMAHRNLGDM